MKMSDRLYCMVLTLCVLTASTVSIAGCVRDNDEKKLTEPTALFTDPSQGMTDETIPSGTTSSVVVPLVGIQEDLSYLDDTNFQGTVLVAKDGQIVFEKSYGYSDVENEIRNTNGTVYEIGQITKQFTAVGIMRLVEDGLLDLDDPLSTYIPEYPHATEMTIRQMLNMTSGIPGYLDRTLYDMNYVEDKLRDGIFDVDTLDAISQYELIDYSFEDVLTQVIDQNLVFEPGTDFSYSNTGYVFLAEVIARVSEVPFVHYMQKNVLSPAGFETASFDPAANTANGYLSAGDTQILVSDAKIDGDGGLRMCANDLYLWTQIIMSQRLISPENWEIVLDGGEFDYGFGFDLSSEKGIECVGKTAGFSCSEMIYQEDNLVIIILANRRTNADFGNELVQRIDGYYQ